MSTFQGKCVLANHMTRMKERQEVDQNLNVEDTEEEMQEENTDENESDTENVEFNYGSGNKREMSDLHLKQYVLCNAILDRELLLGPS